LNQKNKHEKNGRRRLSDSKKRTHGKMAMNESVQTFKNWSDRPNSTCWLLQIAIAYWFVGSGRV
jgi:hypothetical protein